MIRGNTASRRSTVLWILILAMLMALPDAGFAGAGKNRKKQSRPIKLGTSGGNINNINGLFCYSGTLGALLQMEEEGSTRYFVLGNNHILARENFASAGEGIVQPGLADVGCFVNSDNVIAELSGFTRLKEEGKNVVDAAIAETIPEAVDASGKIIGIGIPGTDPLKASVGLVVKKSGAGTGLTRGTVMVTNATVDVIFVDNPLEAFEVIRFKNQLIILSNNPDKRFNSGGDAGSLVVEDVDSCPRPVGLLMFSDQTGLIGVANRMDKVLKAAKKMKPKGTKTVVGCAPAMETASLVHPAEETEMLAASRAQRRVERQILAIPGVTGIGLSQDPERRPVVMILATSNDQTLRDAVPARIDGFATDIMVAGPFMHGSKLRDQ